METSVYAYLFFYGPQLKKVKNCRKYNASGTFTYYFISLKRKQFFFLVPRYYGLSLLRTLNLSPEGVGNNGSQLYIATDKEVAESRPSLLSVKFAEHKGRNFTYSSGLSKRTEVKSAFAISQLFWVDRQSNLPNLLSRLQVTFKYQAKGMTDITAIKFA